MSELDWVFHIGDITTGEDTEDVDEEEKKNVKKCWNGFQMLCKGCKKEAKLSFLLFVLVILAGLLSYVLLQLLDVWLC